MRWATILAVGLVLAALAHGGIYAAVTPAAGQSDSGSPSFYRINRFTGSIVLCMGPTCIAAERADLP